MSRALCIAGLVLLGLSCAAAAATGAGKPQGRTGKPKEPTLKITPARFTMKWTQCAQLPEGLVVSGRGTKRHYDYSTIGADGVNHHVEINLITGTAQDNRGGRYTFNYHDTFTA